jgi:hypothetical protein
VTIPQPPNGYTAIQRMAWWSRRYFTEAQAYRDLAIAAGVAEADYRSVKAQAVLTARAGQDGRGSMDLANATADADKTVADACLAYKVAVAIADASQKMLRALDAAVQACRTEVASDREADKLAAAGADGTP